MVYLEAYTRFLKLSQGLGQISKQGVTAQTYLENQAADKNYDDNVGFQEWLNANRNQLHLSLKDSQKETENIMREIRIAAKDLSLSQLINLDILGMSREELSARSAR